VSRDERTYGKIRQKYDAWVQAEAKRPPRAFLRRVDEYVPVAQESSDMSRTIFAVIGFGLGAILLLLAGYSFYTSSVYASFGRDGGQTGYALAGFFLLIAGIGGIAATWNHNFRVLTRRTGTGSH
jgi:hypothetical protein